MKKTLNVLCAVSLIVLVLSCGNTNQPSNGGFYSTLYNGTKKSP